MGVIRRPRKERDVFGVRVDAASACTDHSVRFNETNGMPPVAGFPASRHGPCHRPAYPSATVRRHTRARVAFCLPCCHGPGDVLTRRGFCRNCRLYPRHSGRGFSLEPPINSVIYISYHFSVLCGFRIRYSQIGYSKIPYSDFSKLTLSLSIVNPETTTLLL